MLFHEKTFNVHYFSLNSFLFFAFFIVKYRMQSFGMRMIPCLQLKRKGNFSQAPQEEPSLRYRYVRGTLCFVPQVEWTPRCPDSKEGRVSLQRLHACSSFISQDERMSESPVETLEKALGLHFISKMGLTCL